MLNPYCSLRVQKEKISRKNKLHFTPPFWCLSLIVCNFCLFFSPGFYYSLIAKSIVPKPVNLEISNSCSEQSLETLTAKLMLDIPGYTNRVIQRSRRLSRNFETFSYILVAGKPEFESLPLNPGIDYGNNYKAAGVKQIFFTTLERKYINKKPVELQEFHRLFLTKTNIGWTVVMMFSQTSEYPVKPPLAPPRNSSHGAIAQGVKLWLQDCQAGSVR